MGQARAWGWVSALREGSTTPWAEWTADGVAPPGRKLPGAQQLELLRRLNLHAQAAGRSVPAATADRVLSAGVSGRGRSDLPLDGADDPRSYGARPVDPGALSADELLRVATTLLADDVAALPAPTDPPMTLSRKLRAAPRMLRHGYHLLGDQWLADAYRDQLVADGHPPGGRRPTPYVVGGDVATLVVHAWTSRAFDQGGPTWTEFLEAFDQAGHLPPRADLAAIARSATYDAVPVTLVLDPAQLATAVGSRPLQGPPRLGAHAVDLVRRVGAPLGLLVATEVRPRLLRATLGRRLDGHGGPTLTVPPRHEAWLRTQAERQRSELAAGGYPVLGDLDRLLPGPLPAEPVLPADAEVLDLALELLLDPLTTPPPTPEEGRS